MKQDELWRVVSYRKLGNRELRHTNYFTNETAAWEHASWVGCNGGRVERVHRVPRPQPSTR